MKVLITGASRGLGAAIARCFARKHGDKARIALLARSAETPAHPVLDGTLAETARDVEACGGKAFVIRADAKCAQEWRGGLRDALAVLQQPGESTQSLDVLINNASALEVLPQSPQFSSSSSFKIRKSWSVSDPCAKEAFHAEDLAAECRKMDLLYQVNSRATLLAIRDCLSALHAAEGSIVTLSPPVRLGRLDWISDHPAYTISKYGMTLATLAHASRHVRANCLWPRHTVATHATRRLEQTGLAKYQHVHTYGLPPGAVAEAVHALAVEQVGRNAQTLFDDDVLPDLLRPMQSSSPRPPLDVFAWERH